MSRDIEKYGEKKWDDPREPQPEQEFTLEEALRVLDRALTHLNATEPRTYTAKCDIKLAIEIIERKL